MINLLPPKNKEDLLQEKNWKQVTLLGFLAFFILVSFSLILATINIFLAGEVETQKILYQQRLKELESPRVQELKKGLVSFNQTLSRLDAFYEEKFNLSEVLEEISGTLPPGTYLTSLSIVPGKKGEQKISCSLSGFSPTRNILLKLKENLDKKDNIEEIYFPPSNWVQSKDVNFSVSFKLIK
ncbi:MAG: hypothetical protein Q8P08_00410 [bacterium]|nr:hypothetical protein [bacterium]